MIMNSLEQLSTISSEQLYFEFKETAALYPNRAASCLEGKINLDGESSELRIQMSNIQDQEDDVDLFVSPRRFGGRTPGPKATKQKVFDEELAKRASQNSERDDIPIEDLKYNFPPVIDDDDVHNHIGRNNCFSKVLMVANFVLAIFGIIALIIAIWVLTHKNKDGVIPYLARQGLLLRSPTIIALVFIGVSVGCIVSGLVVGVRHLAPSAVDGLQLERRRTAFIFYHVTMFLTTILLGFIFFTSFPTMHHIREVGISRTAWQDMSIFHPDRVCKFEIENKCAGVKDGICTSKVRARSKKGCPGHYCSDTCRVATSNPASDKPLCSGCINLLKPSIDILRDCRISESKNESAVACVPKMKGQVTHFLLVIVAISGTGVVLLMIISCLGILSPIANRYT